MAEPTWFPVRVPPLQRDLDRYSRNYRRTVARLARGGWFMLFATLGLVSGVVLALTYPGGI